MLCHNYWRRYMDLIPPRGTATLPHRWLLRKDPSATCQPHEVTHELIMHLQLLPSRVEVSWPGLAHTVFYPMPLATLIKDTWLAPWLSEALTTQVCPHQRVNNSLREKEALSKTCDPSNTKSYLTLNFSDTSRERYHMYPLCILILPGMWTVPVRGMGMGTWYATCSKLGYDRVGFPPKSKAD